MELSFFYSLLITGSSVTFLYSLYCSLATWAACRRVKKSKADYRVAVNVLYKLGFINTLLLGYLVFYLIQAALSDSLDQETNPTFLFLRLGLMLFSMIVLALPASAGALLSSHIDEEG